MELATFFLFALLTLGSAVIVVLHRNPVYSTMSLVVTLISLAALFLLLGAPFIATLQVLIYTGAILVLFLFVIMLLNVQDEELPRRTLRNVQGWTAALAAAVFAGLLVTLSLRSAPGGSPEPLTEEFVSLKGLARQLFQDWLLPFEIVGLLLLVAVIAATVLARKPEHTSPAPESSGREGSK